ncbi:UNVERIFIED_CONTAM: hypothetical protein PYX00_000717 [Menopon gallinae]|uniref:Uncharacterized protein n=1 Tax=Menopon gallinae TaxID=328185 RepID=A0AAW2IAA4_9NEOP
MERRCPVHEYTDLIFRSALLRRCRSTSVSAAAPVEAPRVVPSTIDRPIQPNPDLKTDKHTALTQHVQKVSEHTLLILTYAHPLSTLRNGHYSAISCQ